MGKIIEGVWDCPYCGTDKVRGSLYECPVCGRQRDSDIRFYIDNPKNYISDDEAKKLNKNPDWLCSYCDALNSDDNSHCYNCNASREESEMNYFENQAKIEAERLKKRAEANAAYANSEHEKRWDSDSDIEDEVRQYSYVGCPAESDDVNEVIANLVQEDFKEDYRQNQEMLKKRRKKKIKRALLIGGAILAAILVVVGTIWLVSPKTHDAVVESFSWERSIEIEEYQTVKENDWAVPDGGRVYDKKTEIKSYNRVVDHYETKTRTYTEQVIDHYETYVVGHRDLGNGRFEEITAERPVYRTETRTETYQEPVYREEPVYATKYYYEIERWVHKTYVKTSKKDHSPTWGEYKLSQKEREGARSETYRVVVKLDNGKTKNCTLSFEDWSSLTEGQTITLKIHIDGSAEIVKK